MRHRTAFVILPFLAGCEVLFPVVEDVSDGASDVATQNDTSPSDASADVSTEASADGSNDVTIDTMPMNLVLNPGFELGTTLCGDDWTQGNNVVMSFSSEAHSGKHACLVCSSGNGGVVQTVTVAFDAGVSFAFTAYIAVPPDGGAKATLEAHAFYLDGGQFFDQNPTLDDSGAWQQFADPFTTQYAGTSILLSINPPNGGQCILVDDVSLVAN
jgi:hypothetical protein